MYNIYLKLIIFAAVLMLMLINLSWGLFAVVGFSIGIAIRSFIAFLHFRKLTRHVLVLLAVLIITGLIIWTLPIPMGVFYKLSLSQIENIKYSVHIIYLPKGNLWEINEEIQIDKKRIEELLQEQIRYKWPGTPKQQQSPTVANVMSSHGWETSGMMNGKLKFTRQRKQPASVRWFPVYTTNTIFIPEIKLYDLIIRPDNESQVILEAPKQMVAITYPYYSSRVDLLKGNREQLVIPIALASEDRFTLRIQVLSPLFRNRVGKTIIQASIWSPIRWIILALCLIFAEQIKRGILIPFVRKVFHFLGIPYLEDKKQC